MLATFYSVLNVIKKKMRRLLFNMTLANEISEEAMHKILDIYYGR